MAKITRPGLLLAVGLLSGCVNPYPQPIVTVSEDDAVIKDGNVRKLNPAWQKGKSTVGLNAPVNLRDFRLNVEIYHNLYSTQHRDLVNTLNTADGATVLGGLWGVAGALTGTKAWMYQGAGLAGTSAIYTDHYQIKVQSENYFKASEAMRCMYRAVAGMPDGRELSAAGLRTADIAIDDVTAKLSRVQRDVVLAEPDFNRLKKALLLTEPAGADFVAKQSYTADQVDADILPKLEKCVSEF